MGKAVVRKMPLKGVLAAKAVNSRHVSRHVALLFKLFRANGTLERFDITEAVDCRQVFLQSALLRKALRTDITLESLRVTTTVNSFHVQTHAAARCELPAADLTCVFGVRMLWS